MAHMDVFKNSAFSMMSLTRGLENLPFKPTLLGDLKLFQPRPIRTKNFTIEERNGTLSLIPFSERGEPAPQGKGDGRKVRNFQTRHFKKQDKIWASEVAGIREFGTESELQQVQKEVAYRAAKLRREAELTFEWHRMNALHGLVKNTDGTELVNLFTEFGISEATEVNFDLANASPAKGALRKKCYSVITQIEDALEGAAPGAVLVEAICGKAFYEDLTSHPEVIDAYLHAAKLSELAGKPMEVFDWGGIRWRRYRGGSGVAIDTNKCRLSPVDIEGLFEHYSSPAETFEFVNTPGQEYYFRLMLDEKRQEYAELELEANPMLLCTRPKVLIPGKRTA